MKKVELLAPAGNFEALAAAVESGADAVYLGGNKFNARAYADNFDEETLIKAVNYAHVRGVKVYVTVNILLTDSELIEALEYIRFLYEADVDAIIVQDIALLKLVSETFPDLEIHCSTQMTVHSTGGARYYASLGARRIVLARELSLQEVSSIVSNAGVEAEIFIHGALCVSYSGQCLMSSLIGGRSGNRGRCAQPCRKKYSFYDFKRGRIEERNKGMHLLSTRDLNTYNRLEDLVRSGVASLKIEGRMKKPEYVAIVVKHYRDALDRIYGKKAGAVSKDAEYELKSAFNREFTEGYLFGRRNSEIVSIERPDNRGVFLGKILNQKKDMASILIKEGYLNDGDGIEIVSPKGMSTGAIISGIRVGGKAAGTAYKGDIAEIFLRDRVEAGSRVSKTFDSQLDRKAREEYSRKNRRKIAAECKVIIKAGENPVIIVRDEDGNTVSYTDWEKLQPAVKAATGSGKVAEQLQKTGDTPYLLEIKEIITDGNCHVPVKQINRMRREVLELLSQKRSRLHDRQMVRFSPELLIERMICKGETDISALPEYIAGVRNFRAAVSALDSGADTVYLLSAVYEGDIVKEAVKLAELCRDKGKSLFYVLPVIIHDREASGIKSNLESIAEKSKLQDFGLVISGPGEIEMAKNLGIGRIRINYTFNVFNSVSANHLYKEGAEAVGLSPELTLDLIRTVCHRCPVPVEAVVYGYLPVMTTEYCPVSMLKTGCNNGGCINSDYGIIDEKRKVFRLIRLDACRTQILNPDLLFLAEDLDDILRSGISKLRADFFFESPEEIGQVLKLYRNFRNMDKEDKALMERIKAKGFTRGHFYRGVE